MSGKLAEVGSNSAITRHPTDVAAPINSIKSPPLSSSSSPISSPLTTLSTSFPSRLPAISSSLKNNQLRRPFRRPARSLSCPTDTSIATTEPKLQRTRRTTKPKSNSITTYQKQKIKYDPPLSMITQGIYTTLPSSSQTPPPLLTSTSTSTTPTTSSKTTRNWLSHRARTLANKSPSNDTSTSFINDIPHSSPTTSLKSPTKRSSIVSSYNDKSSSGMSVDMVTYRFDHTPAQSARDRIRMKSHGIPHQFEDMIGDESDVFLKAAKEEEEINSLHLLKCDLSSTTARRPRTSYSPRLTKPNFGSILSRTHDRNSISDSQPCERSIGFDKSEFMKDKKITIDNLNKANNYYRTHANTAPNTPIHQNIDIPSPDYQTSSGRRNLLVPCAHQQSCGGSSSGGSRRKNSVSDAGFSSTRFGGSRHLRGLSNVTAFHSSPLAPRSTEIQDSPDTSRNVEDTESTVSTNAQSTVWDELEDLKSRIHRLESSGKITPNSGAEMSHIPHERPRTATTTVTTMSTSPNRDRANKNPPQAEQVSPASTVTDTNQLLKSALTKSKQNLDNEVYSALEATASDALSISSMMGSSGQAGPFSQSQVNPDNSKTVVSDRQVRRKAESMCRSLTELCLALSEKKSENSNNKLVPSNRDVLNCSSAEPPGKNHSRLSPRTLSNLEVRRSSLLAPSIHTSPPTIPESEGSSKITSGRRASLIMRGSRYKLNGTEEDDEPNLRTPSRVFSEIHSFRNSSREKMFQFSLSENAIVGSSKSQMPLRIQHTPRTAIPTMSSGLGSCRSLERSTPDRDIVASTNSFVTRVIEDRGQKSSFGPSLVSESTRTLTRRPRKSHVVNYTSAGQGIGFH